MTRRRGAAWASSPSFVDAFHDLRADYDAARPSRFRRKHTGIPVSGSGADWHIRTDRDLMRLVEISRHFDRNDSLVGQGISRLASYVMGDGFPLYPQTGDVDADAALADLWRDWKADPAQCHTEGEHTFDALAELAFRATIVDGDVFALPVDGAVQLVESHRCRAPTRSRKISAAAPLGVEVDKRKRRIAYWFTSVDIDPSRQVLVSDAERYPAWDAAGERSVLHIYDPKRSSQLRGIGALAPIMDVAGMLEDIQIAKLLQQQVVSCFAIIREKAAGVTGTARRGATGETVISTDSDGGRRVVEGVQPGAEIVGAAGETIKGFSPNVPNSEYFQQAHLLQMIIAANLDLPIAMLLLDAESTNYSGFRGALLSAQKRFRRFQRNMVLRFHSPVYRYKIRDWIATEPAVADIANRIGAGVFRHAFHPTGWAYIDPQKEAAAHLLATRNGIKSLSALHAELGQYYPAVLAEIIADHELAIVSAYTAAERVNAANPGLGIHWRELLALPMPDGVSVAISPAAPASARAAGGAGAAPVAGFTDRRAQGDAIAARIPEVEV
jgi:lambda family phage portal protein